MGRPEQEKVVAVVVAYARTASLERVLAALRDQSRPADATVIVDNEALPEVKAAIEKWRAAHENVEVEVLEKNAGSAGGFAAGLEAAAREPGAAWIAVFDDDAIPAPDCIEQLLEAGSRIDRPGAVGATSMNAEGEFAWPMYVIGRRDPLRTYDELTALAGDDAAVPVFELAWHAVLFPVATLEKVGPPRRDLYMWYEDVEYGLRLRREGLTAYVVPRAKVEHPPVERVVRRRLLGVELDVPVVSPSKTYLMTRNALVVRRDYVGPQFWVVDLPLTVLRGVIAAAALPGPTLKLLRRAVLRAVADAARGRLGPPPSAVLALDGPS